MNITLVETPQNPGDAKLIQDIQRAAGERIQHAWLMCPTGCHDAIYVGRDQWNGLQGFSCKACRKSFWINGVSLISIGG